jgi:hypothetical protein
MARSIALGDGGRDQARYGWSAATSSADSGVRFTLGDNVPVCTLRQFY